MRILRVEGCIARTAVCLLVAAAWLSAQAASAEELVDRWPSPDEVAIPGERISFASRSPFVPADIGGGPEDDPKTEAKGTLFLPHDASAADPVPGVVLLHGALGVSGARELTYGRQLAAMGIAALVVDSFAARRGMAQDFIDRLVHITETMVMADAYAALAYFDARPEVDARRVALVGFSYGGMASTYAAYEQMATALAPKDLRFAGHAAFYAPCIARFEDRRTTGAPVLMLMGSKDEIIDLERCAEIADDMRAGGSEVEMVVYNDAHHQWDGARSKWRAPRTLVDCSFSLAPNGEVRDRNTYLPMNGPFTRKLILALCSDESGYLIARDDRVRARSNRDLGRFLSDVLDPGGAGASERAARE